MYKLFLYIDNGYPKVWGSLFEKDYPTILYIDLESVCVYVVFCFLFVCFFLSEISFYVCKVLLFCSIDYFPISILISCFFLFIIFLIFPCTARGSGYPYMYILQLHFSPTLCSVATWVSRQSSQCYSAGSPCKSILSCVW